MNVNNFDPKKIFEKLKTIEINGGISSKRIPIKYLIEDEPRDLIRVLITEKCFSWGIQSDGDKFQGQEGFCLPIVLFDKENPTENQKKFEKMLNEISTLCRKHCVFVKEGLGKFDLEERDLTNIFSSLYVKKEFDKKTKKYTPVENYPPTLYAKLLYSKKDKKILTKFYKCKDVEDETEIVTKISPEKHQRKRMYVKATIKVDNIYIGSTITLQLRVLDVKVSFIESNESGYLNHQKVCRESESD